jgi:3',5'-cyclic AMP phosphodiesterase CpdA
MSHTKQVSRRALLHNGTLLLSATAAFPSSLMAEEQADRLSIGLVTDLHYADKPAAGTRHYRETPQKLATAAEQLGPHRPDFIVELGDLIDAADSVATELGYLKRINRDFSALCPHRHYVLGNHCVATLTKQEFLDGAEQKDSFYSFDAGAFHFIVLDSCFRGDGEPYGRNNFTWTDTNIPEHEIEWLKADLAQSPKQAIVLAHQRLDVSNHYGVKNAANVRRVLEASNRVLAVLQGHSHKNDYHQINGIHYCTFVAMVEGSGLENNAFSLLQLAPDGSIRIEGFVKQQNYQWHA